MHFLLLGAAAGLAFAVRNHLATPYDPLFDEMGARYHVPPNLLRAIARVESGFRPDAVSPENINGTKDYGLMQLNTATLRRVGLSIADAMVPRRNVDAAARLLQSIRGELGERFSSFTWPMAYNVGSDLHPAIAGEDYARRVLWHWQLYDLGRMFAPPERTA